MYLQKRAFFHRIHRRCIPDKFISAAAAMTVTSSMMSRMGHVTVRPTQPTFGKVVGALLWSYVGPVIFIVGVVGNVLILVTMAQRRMRGTSTCVYLRCMAVADLAVLLTGMIPEWLEARGIVTIKVKCTFIYLFIYLFKVH